MSIAGCWKSPLRAGQAESYRLAWAFALSLAFHLLAWGGYHAALGVNSWLKVHSPAWRRALEQLAQNLKPEPLPVARAEWSEPPLFMEVSPEQAQTEPPKDAKYYSDKNSKAGNPNPDKATGLPKIDGRDADATKTVDSAPLTVKAPLQPALPPKPSPPAPEPPKPKPAAPPSDLALNKPEPAPKIETAPPGERPRTMRQPMLRDENQLLAGNKMKQDGGVKRRVEMASLDVQATPFGAYDAALIRAVTLRWDTVRETREYHPGKVSLMFRLHYDGRVSDMRVLENTLDEMTALICQKTILDCAPFAPWPMDMRRAIADDYRPVEFIFLYP